MGFEREDIERIAKLAHLDVPEGEAEPFRRQISSILEYVGQLGEVDLKDVEPTAHVTGVSNVLREDVVRATPSEVRQALLDAAPAREGDLIKVKAVFQ